MSLKLMHFSATGEAMCLCGDPAYTHRIHLQGPFKEQRLTPAKEDFNSAMSLVPFSVEWVFGDVIGSFKCLDFKKNLKIGLSPDGKHYIVSALLRNALTCLYGNNTRGIRWSGTIISRGVLLLSMKQLRC